MAGGSSTERCSSLGALAERQQLSRGSKRDWSATIKAASSMSACGLHPDGRREPAKANYHLALATRCPMLRARLLATLAAGLLLTITTPPSFGQILRIAMTASDTPTTTGIPNKGFARS